MKDYYPEGTLLKTEKNRLSLSSLEGLRRAMEEEEVLEAVATICDCEHDLMLDLGQIKGVIPRQEGALGIREGAVRDIAILSRVGKPVSFLVEKLSLSEKTPTAFLSRARAQQRCLDDYLSKKRVGDVIDARITHLEAFGAFCDIGCGVVALMPIDTISISRITHPRERFFVGMDVKAVIKSKDGSRITLSRKELLGTWQQNADRFSVGETVSGVVRSVENYGAFVELGENLAGLAELKDGIKAGDRVSVYIKSIIPQKMKIKLVIIDTLEKEERPPRPRYFIQDGHIDRFVYSPESCAKRIETRFE